MGKGTRLVDVTDGVSGQSLRDPTQAKWLTLQQIEAAAFELVGQRRVTLVFHSPLLILRTPVHTSKFFMDDRVVDGAVLLQRVKAKVDEHFSVLAPASDPPSVLGVVNELARADANSLHEPTEQDLLRQGPATSRCPLPSTSPWPDC